MGSKKCTTVETDLTLGREYDALTANIRTALTGNYPVEAPTLAIGSTATAVSNAAFVFSIAGAQYSKAAVTAGTALGTKALPAATYGAVALDIGINGTPDPIVNTSFSTGKSTASLAVLDLPVAAVGHARMGYVTITKSDGAFTLGTTDLDAANTTVVYTDGDTTQDVIGDAVA